jgi:hypothetical protein
VEEELLQFNAQGDLVNQIKGAKEKRRDYGMAGGQMLQSDRMLDLGDEEDEG